MIPALDMPDEVDNDGELCLDIEYDAYYDMSAYRETLSIYINKEHVAELADLYGFNLTPQET